jgi:4-amino-4-deoxy-L-arabinose transferase-like glycosyltransferase
MTESETKREAPERESAPEPSVSEAEPTPPAEKDAVNGVHENGVNGVDAPGSEKEAAPVAKTEPSDEEPKADPLLARGNPLRVRRGLVAILAGGIPAFLLMAKNGQNGWGIALGAICVAIATFGAMDLVGSFDDATDAPETTTTLEALAPSLGASLGLVVAFGASLWLAQAAIIPAKAAAVLVPATFIALVAAVFALGKKLGPWRIDELGNERPLLQRHGFWICVIGALLYLPTLGIFSLWDPWETHYGEVAREILSRDDWISLWWAQDGWFWSKPILNFWIQSLAMGSLGTHYAPDQMLMAANGTAAAHAEWVVRAPNVLMTIGAMYLLYKGVAKVFGRRAGLLGAIVLATTPDWFFLAHQTMTDMPFVAAMTAAMGLLLYGLNTDEEMTVRLYEVRAFGKVYRVSLWHLVFGAVLLCAIPQIVYLLSRNIELVVFGDGPKGFRFHWDEFKSGSPGNCGLPGNEACNAHVPASLPKQDTWWWHKAGGGALDAFRFLMAAEPAMQALVWGGVLGGILYLNWGERRVRRLVYIGAWLAAAIATMAKGPAGFGLPIICAFAYVGTKRRWSELLRFELVTGLLVIACVALPWYVAMYVRHGSPFTDRLIFHDMFNRAFSHVHDTNEGDDTGLRYYIWQFGYAVFPWTGLAPLGLLWGFRRSDSALARTDSSRATAVGDASVMLVMWFLFAFALFTFMGTKFHHYIFPAVPPAAMLVGVVLDDMLGQAPLPSTKSLIKYVGALTLAGLVATLGASRWLGGSIFGAKSDAPGSPMIAIVGIVIGAAIFAAVAATWKERASADEDAVQHHESLMLGAAAVAGALFLALVGRDLATPGGETSGGIRLLQLFTYNYKRPWPDTVDFSAVLAGFTVVALLVGLVLGVRSLRRHAVVAMCGFAMLWAVWGLDVYMMTMSPHWGQHEVIEAYYRDRASADEVLVAYQMNWKGENFYTGNHVPAFVSTGANFQQWMKKERERGAKVMYFVTEHSRTSGLRSEVGAKAYKEITDKALNNKFVLVRAEL